MLHPFKMVPNQNEAHVILFVQQSYIALLNIMVCTEFLISSYPRQARYSMYKIHVVSSTPEIIWL